MDNYFFLLLFLVGSLSLPGQIVTTEPAAPVADGAVTITFDATQGTGGLKDCNCDVYLHTGVITPASTNAGDWKYVKTRWGVANEAWKLTPVADQPNLYTYTIEPSIRQYYGVPTETEIRQLALVFRDATGDREGKAAGGSDIFIDVAPGGNVLSVNLAGDPGTATYPLGKPLPVTAGATASATLELYDNDRLLTRVTGRQLDYDLQLTTPGEHTIRVVATVGEESVSQSFTVDAVLAVDLLEPAGTIVGAAAGDRYTIVATSYVRSELRLTANGAAVATVTDSVLSREVVLPERGVVTYTVQSRYAGETATTAVTFVTGSPETAVPPAGFDPGASRMASGNLLLQLRAPGKSDVFVIGNFNDWSPTAAARMKRSAEGGTFWLEIPAAELPDGDLLYQYVVDLDKRHADPYSTLILDPFNDPFIDSTVFAGIPDYPTGRTEGIVSWLRLDAPDYAWRVNDFSKPDPERMVIYELLVRDFLADHSFRSLTDTLDYLDRLGVNTIELLPVSEFEGNISWGYNPSFHMALDKYYGSPEDLKALVDACHARGMAVVLDVVYNHAFGQSPLVRIWSDATGFQPNAQNPYANVVARHPFNVGYDLNHESDLTQEYVKTTLTHWMREFRVDGFRFDLSKGFTQNFSGDVGAWNRYDASRVAILKDYADHVWSVDPTAYMIMEHLGESREEDELAQYGNGMYFWSGRQPHDGYLQAAMGYDDGDDLNPVLAVRRGFTNRSLVAYMESHDEERMMYKNEQFGNASRGYDVRDTPTGLDRVELASAFFYTLPGPKMLWQFGELGYDYSIDYCQNGTINSDCRTDPKPIGWRYRDDPDRQDVYNTIADLLYLRNNFDFFHGDLTLARLSGQQKRVHFRSGDGMAAVVGNFSVDPARVTDLFPSTGTWYDYFSGETINVTNLDQVADFAPGEWHLYLSRDIARGGGRLTTGTNDAAVAELRFTVSPNPTAGTLNVAFTLDRTTQVAVDLLDTGGKLVARLHRGRLAGGAQSIGARVAVPGGLYFVRINDGRTTAVRRVVVR